MLSINIDQVELFNEQTNEFFYLKPIVLKLEHSLISISKWEAKWHKPFADSQKTDAEMRDYIRCIPNQNGIYNWTCFADSSDISYTNLCSGELLVRYV